MKTIRSLALPILWCFLLCGCRGGGALFFFEAPYFSVLGDETRLRVSFTRAALMKGMLPRLVVSPPGQDPNAQLSKILTEGGCRMAVVGPFLSYEWNGFVGGFPGTRFLLVGPRAPQDADLPANATFLSFDTREAFRSAGREAAQSVRERPAADPARGLAVLTARGSDLSAEEIDAFLEGAAEALDGARPGVRAMEPSADKSVVRSTIQEMRGSGVEVFLLGLGSLAPAGLESLRDLGGRAVVAGWAGSEECPAQVLLSIEEDVPGGITAAVRAAMRGEPRVSGDVRIVRGGGGK